MARRITAKTSDAYRGWVHERLLNAAVSVYARYGSAGATTRRIAAEAEVNEVTLFRHFGSKEALLEMAMQEAMRRVLPRYGPRGEPERLPAVPVAPHEELTRWCVTQIGHLREVRGVLQYAFAENIDYGHVCDPHVVFLTMHDVLREYVADLRRHGFGIDESRVTLAVAMLVSVLATDGMGRDDLERMFPPATDAAANYARCFLEMLGIMGAAAFGDASRTPPGEPWPMPEVNSNTTSFAWCEPDGGAVNRTARAFSPAAR